MAKKQKPKKDRHKTGDRSDETASDSGSTRPESDASPRPSTPNRATSNSGKSRSAKSKSAEASSSRSSSSRSSSSRSSSSRSKAAESQAAKSKSATAKSGQSKAAAKRTKRATAERKKRASDDASADQCVVVGVGASAGGLDAYKQLLRSLPDDPGVAFVLIQHLDPTHESLMVELLTKYTSMPVLQVQEATSIERNHVYMIPPNRFIKIRDDGLFLDDPVTQRGVRLPIDYFFRSLAEARQARAICVVLSGTGSDGAAGVREIKAAGGMTIVQQPDTAEYDGMPRAAMSTGAVDFVLPISKMAEVIVPYARHPYVQKAPKSTLADSSPDHYRAILSLLRAYTDQDFSRYKKGTLTRRIERRMGIRQVDKPGDYLHLLREDSDELQELFKDLLIGVTRFFRDDEAWNALASELARTVLQDEHRESFRVWIPGCSTGEEAYTVAILLDQLQRRHDRRFDVQIFATDIDRDSVSIARAGVYPENVAKDLSEEQLDAYFRREGGKFVVRKKLRESCIFAVQNLLSDPPFSNLDLICCRNLLIYLEADVQSRVFSMFHFALRPSGLLLLGTSESPAKQKQMFKTIAQRARLYRKQGDSTGGTATLTVASQYPASEGNPQRRTLENARSVGIVELSKKALLDEFAPASVVVDHRGEVQFIHGPVRQYLDFPRGEPSLDLGAMALDGLKAKIRTALHRARSAKEPVSTVAPRVRRDNGYAMVRIRVQPLPSPRGEENFYLVSFRDEEALNTGGDSSENGDVDHRADEVSADRQLALELQATREDLQSTIEELESANEELKASNEEVTSMNEELQSTNEELETSREELQSLNEELSTVNNQLYDKVEELEATNNDLTNLLVSTDMATLFLDTELRIRRFTPATTHLINVLESDLGRPVSDLSTRVNDPDLVENAKTVLERLTPIEREVKNEGTRWFLRRIRPFRTAENKIEGVVVTYAEITKVKDAVRRVEMRERQQATIAKLGRAALSGTELDELFERAVREVADTLHVDFAKLLRLEENRRRLKLIAGVGWNEGIVGNATVPSGIESQAGFTLHSRGPVIVKDLVNEKRFQGPALLTEHGVVSGVSVLIGPEDDPWGVFGVHSRKSIEYTIDDANFVLAVANVLWEAIRRRSIERRLEDSEARMSAFLNNSIVIAWMKDEQGRYTYLSPDFKKRFVAADDQWLGKSDEELWPLEVARVFRENDRKVLESQQPVELVEEAVYPNGQRGQFLSMKFPFTDARGNRYVGGLGVDITARVRAERALAESEERLRLAARMAEFGTYYGDYDTGEVQWTPELRAIFGIAGDGPSVVPIAALPDFVHQEDRDRVAQKIADSLDPSGDGDFHDEYRVVRPDGDTRWILMQGRTAFVGTGTQRRPSRVAGVVLDITERRHAQEELEQARQAAEAASEAKSVFLANMSHEIRTPLTAILGYADVLHAQLEDEHAVSCVRTIKDNGAYLCEIINDILDLSKIEAGKLTVRRDETSVIEILADIRSLMTVRATEKSLALSAEFVGELPAKVHTDAKMVRQILVNLVGNAIKFTEHGTVNISARCLREQELIEIAVADSGIGIDERDLQHLFLPFEQIDNSFTRTAGGSGLGLAISQKLVEMLGGTLEVESSVGQGSTFRFTFATGPLDDADWTTPDAADLRALSEPEEAAEIPHLPARVLAADDRAEIRYLVQAFVEEAGGEVESVNNGEEAVAAYLRSRADGQPPDAILMDIQMPVLDGLEATRRLRAEGYDGPIIALTANAMSADQQRSLAAGCDDFVAKPIDRAKLLGKLAEWTSKPRQQASDRRPQILCVDDSEEMGRLQKMLLERLGYEVYWSPSGPDAFKVLDEITPDVAILDLGLQEMSGSELLAQMKTKPQLTSCRFVCLSGRSEDEVDWQALGFDNYVQKPAKPDQLDQILRRLIDR